MTNFVEKYKALYVGLADWTRRVHGEQDLPEHTALIGLTIFAWLNAFSIFMLVEMISGVRFEIPHLKAWGVAGYFVILVLHYIALFERGSIHRKKTVQYTIGWRLLPYPAASVIVTFTILYIRQSGYSVY